MKLGYLIWSIGWVCIGLGGAAIALGVIQGVWFGVVKGIMILAISFVWFSWGSNKIKKAVIKQTEGKMGNDM